MKEIVPGSLSKSCKEQLQLLPPNYQPPKPVEEVTKSLLHYRQTRQYLNRSVYAHCAALTATRDRVLAGRFVPDGFTLIRWFDEPYDYVGLGAARNPNT